MPRPPQIEAFSFQGQAGSLEALLELPEASPAGVAVVCHPHPEHGGTMQNKVAHTLAKSFLKLNFAALRFNFRGVGKSEGQFADGVGEAEDVLSAVTEAKRRFPGLSLWLAGFSFGAAMAIRVAVAADADGLVSVAPAAHRFAGKLRDQPACPWLIIHAEADELIPIEESIEWVDGLEPGPELVVFPGTSHFFHGQLVTLRDTVQAFVTANHAQSPPIAS